MNPPSDRRPTQVNTFVAHYILLFPIGIAGILIYVKKPHEFPTPGTNLPVFLILLAFTLATFALSRFMRTRAKQKTNKKMLVLLQASLGESCAIVAIVYYLLTGNQNLPWIFMTFWLIHYAITLKELATPLGE
jgi:uncharacterized membrane protein YidH (DUF202 family)